METTDFAQGREAHFFACLYSSYLIAWLIVGFCLWGVHRWFLRSHGFIYAERGAKVTGYRFYTWSPWIMAFVYLYWLSFLIWGAVSFAPVIYKGFVNCP